MEALISVSLQVQSFLHSCRRKVHVLVDHDLEAQVRDLLNDISPVVGIWLTSSCWTLEFHMVLVLDIIGHRKVVRQIRSLTVPQKQSEPFSKH